MRRISMSRLVIAAIIALISFISYFSLSDHNPITGEKQRVALSTKEEIALGLHAAPKMLQQHHGLLPNQQAQAHIDRVGSQLIAALNHSLEKTGNKNPYPFEFHLLADKQIINAFALPGGQVFITAALYNRLTTEGQLAGVLGHEIGHVLARHGAQRLAKQHLTQGLAGAAGVAGGDIQTARMAQAVAQLVHMKYGRADELESDMWGVRLTAQAGYDPRSMLDVMRILEQASGGQSPPEFLSTHPKPTNRVAYIQQVINEVFPNGVPEGLSP
ncbi:M48 family metalloprotease [Nitrosococcus wardiae]|uniref:M48 family peptidase n=1 Tax=Nitrosococcus wardiae TaxID=1814290 RepID=A0A4P7BY59_9GAMM|nr:M48 family metalloprotease [Nitrosococcus wardiae]QBQ54090.1 M48 family peptidase [Nitrosococcus wardiae]